MSSELLARIGVGDSCALGVIIALVIIFLIFHAKDFAENLRKRESKEK